MRTLLISLYPPCKYGGHIGGVVILLYDILSIAPEKVDLIVYNCETQSFELPENVTFKPWSCLTTKKRNRRIRPFKYSLYNDYQDYIIDAMEYSKIILYPYFTSLFNFKNLNADIFTIGMDSGPLLYLRGIIYNPLLKMRFFSIVNFFQSINIDKHATKISKKIFTVGERDAEYYRSVLLANAVYIPHPVSILTEQYKHKGWDGIRRLNLCFPGGFSSFYAPSYIEIILDLFRKYKDKYTDKIVINFLGRIPSKKVEKLIKTLLNEGFEINKNKYVDNYEKFIAEQDIVLLPLEVGVGTKNKALTALAMGCDLIGTKIALENVYGIRNMHVALDANDFINKIDERINSRKLYGLSSSEISDFKKYHSVEQWKRYFWKQIYEE